MDKFKELLNSYGYIIIFISLFLELIALPLPGEIMMGYCGFLIYQGRLNYFFTILVATLGVVSGITTSYFIGKSLGMPFFHKYGKYVGLTPEKLEKISGWFDRVGNKLLTIAYFIPGVRHITGYVSGITNVSYVKFAAHGYIGALIWSTTFITIGKALGSSWDSLHKYATKYLIIGAILLGIVAISIYIYKKYKESIKKHLYLVINNAVLIYNSIRRIEVGIFIVAMTYIALVIFTFKLIGEFLSNEMSIFDNFVYIVLENTMYRTFIESISGFKYISSDYIVILISVLIVRWITLKKNHKVKNVLFIIFTILGGEIFVNISNYILKRSSAIVVIGNINNSFPSKDVFIVSILLGIITYYILRQSENKFIKAITITILITVCAFVGISDIYLKIQNASGVIAAYLFATLWVGLCIAVLELAIIVPEIANELEY